MKMEEAKEGVGEGLKAGRVELDRDLDKP